MREKGGNGTETRKSWLLEGVSHRGRGMRMKSSRICPSMSGMMIEVEAGAEVVEGEAAVEADVVVLAEELARSRVVNHRGSLM